MRVMVKMAGVWDRTAEFLGDNLAAVLPIALLTFFVPASIQGNFAAAMIGAGDSLKILLTVLQIVFAILSVWGSLAITAMALDIAGERSATSIATRRLLPALLVSIVMILVASALVLPVPGVLAFNGYDMAAMARNEEVNMSMTVAMFIVLYLVALVFVIVWLIARFVVATPVLVRESRVLSALGESWRLTRGVALRIVGVIILFAIVSWVATLAAMTVFGSIFALVAGRGDGVTLSSVMTSIVVAAVQSAFMVIPPVFTAKLYLALTAARFRHAEADA